MAKLTTTEAFKVLGLTFKKQILPPVKSYGRVNRKQGIVLHQTGAPQAGANAQAMANYQKNMSNPNNPEEKSWHYQVDDHMAIQSFTHDVATWQSSDGTGPGNTAHISIESCINADGNYAKTIQNTAKLMAAICYLEGFNPRTQIKTHHDFARDKKWCPAQILNGKDGFTLAKVIEMTVGYLNQLNGKVATPSPANNSKKYFDLEPLKADAKAFDALKVGDKVTIRKGQTFWYIPQTNQGVKPTNDFTGDKDIIEQVRDVKVGYSRRAYLLKNKRSWILEQDLVEARRTWNAVKDTDAIFDTDPERVYVYVDGKYYKLVETKK